MKEQNWIVEGQVFRDSLIYIPKNQHVVFSNCWIEKSMITRHKTASASSAGSHINNGTFNTILMNPEGDGTTWGNKPANLIEVDDKTG